MNINRNVVIIAISILLASFIFAWTFRYDTKVATYGSQHILYKTDRWTGKTYQKIGNWDSWEEIKK
ncbi:MAG: hypothetical protein M1308_19230 [Actinobacteria bacterium]|nr:hypothetical protein [Actinomycetota bacterium]